MPRLFNIVLYRNIAGYHYGLEFTLCDHHILLVHFMSYCVVRVISTVRFENTWSAHSAKFENGMETGQNILFSQIGNIILIGVSLIHFYFIFRIVKQSPIGDRFTFYFTIK